MSAEEQAERTEQTPGQRTIGLMMLSKGANDRASETKRAQPFHHPTWEVAIDQGLVSKGTTRN